MVTPTYCKILIIGAGIAGLGAADFLINEYGFEDVIVLEALDRIGGRIHPIPFENGVLEMGAEWIHGKGNPLYKIAKHLGALASQNKRLKRYDGEERRFYIVNEGAISEALKKDLTKMYTHVVDKTENVTDPKFSNVDHLFTTVYKNYMKKLSKTMIGQPYFEAMLSFIKKQAATVNGAPDLDSMSIRQYTELEDQQGDENYVLGPMGFKPILEYFLSKIPAEKILLKSEVIKIAYEDSKHVQIQTSNGRMFATDHVIVTSSIGYLKKNAKHIFHPPLPDDKLNVITDLGYGNLGKIHLIYSEPFWLKNTEDLNILRIAKEDDRKTESSLSKIFFWFEPKPYFESVLTAFVNDSDIDTMESATEDELGSAATELLKSCLMNTDVPKPHRVIKTSWKSHPLFFGSYSYYSTETDRSNNSQRKTLQIPLYVRRDKREVPAVLFAGEATSESQFQTTHGALISGRREAKRIADFYSSKNMKKNE